MLEANRPVWHPGAIPLEGEWLAAAPLRPDEILSSWLVRSALAQGCDPLTLAGHLWPGWRAWTVDLDRSITEAHIKRAAQASGIPASSLRQATLAPVSMMASSNAGTVAGTMPWITVTGARNRKRRTGMQFCSACLAEDASPYSRIQWRCAWHAACGVHGVLLHDRCPKCGVPAQPHRLPADSKDAGRCHACASKLASAPIEQAEEDTLAFQEAADAVVLQGWGSYDSPDSAPAGEWLAMARFFVGLARRAAASRLDVLERLLAKLGIDARELHPPETGLPLEMLPPRERAMLFRAAWRMIRAGPRRLVEAAHSSGATLRTLADRPGKAPSVLLERAWQAIPAGAPRERRPPSKRSRPLSRQAVMRKWARLKRKWAAEK